MGVAGAVAGTFGIQPLVGAFGVPYQAAEPRDERLIRVPLRIGSEMSQGGEARQRVLKYLLSLRHSLPSASRLFHPHLLGISRHMNHDKVLAHACMLSYAEYCASRPLRLFVPQGSSLRGCEVLT